MSWRASRPKTSSSCWVYVCFAGLCLLLSGSSGADAFRLRHLQRTSWKQGTNLTATAQKLWNKTAVKEKATQSKTVESEAPREKSSHARHTHRRSHTEIEDSSRPQKNETVQIEAAYPQKNETLQSQAAQPEQEPQHHTDRTSEDLPDESAPALPTERETNQEQAEEQPVDPFEVAKEAAVPAPRNYTRVAPEDRPPRSGVLDLVLTHYDPRRVQAMLDYWMAFLELPMVQELQPYVYLYCQNENMNHTEEVEPLLRYGGEIVHLKNVGRESHAYLQHITGHFDSLADYTLFAQDLSSDDLPQRFQGLFERKTGFLPLALVGHVDCEDEFLPRGAVPQVYAMFASQLCPPQGYTSGFEGQFIVSRRRIVKHGWWTYRHLLDLLAADEDHWIHSMHNVEYYKDKTNPMFGHVVERAWSVAFDCFESWRMDNCYDCLWNNMQDCGWDSCQCFDPEPES